VKIASTPGTGITTLMSSCTEKGPWVDCLWEKHEYFTYTPRWETLELDGRAIRLSLPYYLPGFTVLAWAEREDLLFLLFQLDRRWGEGLLGAVVVAQRTAENTYTTVIWHELYPYALKHLGFVEEDQGAEATSS